MKVQLRYYPKYQSKTAICTVLGHLRESSHATYRTLASAPVVSLSIGFTAKVARLPTGTVNTTYLLGPELLIQTQHSI